MREHKLKEQQLKEEREQAKKKEAELKICGAEKMQAELVSPSTFLPLFINTFLCNWLRKDKFSSGNLIIISLFCYSFTESTFNK